MLTILILLSFIGLMSWGVSYFAIGLSFDRMFARERGITVKEWREIKKRILSQSE